MPAPSRLSRLLESPRTPLWAALVAVVLSLPCFAVGDLHDDYLHRVASEGELPGYSLGTTSLYDFTPGGTADTLRMRDEGLLPWWTADEFSVRFFRPVSSAIRAFEVRELGDSRAWLRLHSLLWLAGLVGAASLLFRYLLTARSAGVASMIFAAAGCFAVPVTWPAARYALIVSTLTFAALGCYLRFRTAGELRYRLGAVVLFSAALLCGEMALTLCAFVVAFELVGARDRIHTRVLAASPILVIAGGYLLLYASAGYGATGSGMYVNPTANPGAFLLEACTRIPTMLGELTLALPSSLYMTLPTARPIMALLGLLAAVGIAAAVWALARSMKANDARTVAWLSLGSGLALIPLAAGPLGGRLLPIPLLGGAAAAGLLLTYGWRPQKAGRPLGRIALRTAVVAGFAGHLCLSPLTRLALAPALAELATAEQRVGANPIWHCAATTVIIATADPVYTFYGPLAAIANHDEPTRSPFVISMAPQDHRLTRTSETSISLEVVGSRRRVGVWEQLYRAEPMRAGYTVATSTAAVRVEAVDHDWPTRLAVDFRQPLESPELCLVQVTGGVLQQLSAPSIGETILLEHEPGPSGW